VALMSGSESYAAGGEARDVREDLKRARDDYGARAWASAHEVFTQVDADQPLEAEDLERLAVSAYLLGKDAEYLRVLERAHQAHVAAGACARGARVAFWLGFRQLLRGEVAIANGWLGRAARLVERQPGDCVERGYLALLVAQQHVGAGDWDAAHAGTVTAADAGERFQDPDLVAAAIHLQGRVRMEQGHLAEGLSLLDEAMIGVMAGELSPVMTGLVYCSAIDGCQEIHALDRVRQWTAALGQWCAEQPEMLAFVGVCQVHRAEILQLGGAWTAALAEAERASERCLGVNRVAAAAAFYQQGEVHRLRGELAAAEAAYRNASQWGWDPQPGLAQLRLAQGRTAAAVGAIRRAVIETPTRAQRTRLLAAQVEIMLAAGDAVEARKAGGELQALARTIASSLLDAMAAQAMGAVELAEGNAAAAAGLLRRAWQGWEELEVPYAAARVRVLLGSCCRALGDQEGAELELRAARNGFEKLGARPDLAALEPAVRRQPAARPFGLTPRELEVLRLVATGKSNKAIASSLFLSERTVERHVANIFRKLDVPSRAAATAEAYRHALI
jgi:DNA-binding CsgD family transcriptional regulator